MSKQVLTKEEAEKLVVNYTPRKFPAVVSKTASAFVAFQSRHSDDPAVASFRLDKIVAQQTGVAELERLSIEEKVEREALSRLKDLQENAYQQAYQLGLEEGREKAYVESVEHIKNSIGSLQTLLGSIENLKADLVTYNETHIVRLCFYMAKRIAMDEVADRRELILNVVSQAIQNAQSEEELTIRVSPADLQFIEQMKEKLTKEFEPLKRAKLEASDEIRDGGCVVETNYGNVDATVEQRIEKLWDAIAGKLPKVKDETGS
ncbi:MAG: FliH/SctL family protein [Bdellovibrionota bacterium]